jgi:hypothetical protein
LSSKSTVAPAAQPQWTPTGPQLTKWWTNFLREECQTLIWYPTSMLSAAEKWLSFSALSYSGTAKWRKTCLESSWTQLRQTLKWKAMDLICLTSTRSSKMLRKSYWPFSNWYSKVMRSRVHIYSIIFWQKFTRNPQRVWQWAMSTSTSVG